jgi:methionine sulfoxide reductase catalytic subunit
MLIRIPKSWHLPEHAVTDEKLFRDRRNLLKGVAAGTLLAGTGSSLLPGLAMAAAGPLDPSGKYYPAPQNPMFKDAGREVTPEGLASTYNNFYEFGSHKKISRVAQEKLKVRPWEVVIDGLVEKEIRLPIDELLAKMPIEERIYRHRCVEAWSMVVPWSGFPLKELVKLANPHMSAKYIQMQTFNDPEMGPGLKQFWYPWPYTEGLTMAEAMNDLSFMVTGVYGKPAAAQFGAPLRLAVPWKYGFKGVKSIVRISFVNKRPKTFWENIQASEYGFWANVNPEVDHPRWSQASERTLRGERIPTQMFNGYGEQVADLYKDIKGEKLYM